MPSLFNQQDTGEYVSLNGVGSKYTGDKSHPNYNQTYSGSSLNLILQKNHLLPTDVDTDNMIAVVPAF